MGKVWSGSEDGQWQCNKTLRGHSGQILAVASFPDGRIASASDNGTIRIWGVEEQDSPIDAAKHVFKEHKRYQTAAEKARLEVAAAESKIQTYQRKIREAQVALATAEEVKEAAEARKV